MSLPALSNWDHTRTGLHRATQVIGAVRRAVAAPEPNWAHLGTRVVAEGLTTGALPMGELLLDFSRLEVVYRSGEAPARGIPLSGHSQRSLTNSVLEALKAAGHEIQIDDRRVANEAPFDINARLAADYAQALDVIWAALGRLRARLPGEKSPLVVWPHGFDASFLWFPHAGKSSEDRDPHMNFGFSPGSPGLDRPYFYTYAWPLPEGLTDTTLPPGVRWHTEGWTGTVLAYDDLTQEADPVQVIAHIMGEIHEAVSPSVG